MDNQPPMDNSPNTEFPWLCFFYHRAIRCHKLITLILTIVVGYTQTDLALGCTRGFVGDIYNTVIFNTVHFPHIYITIHTYGIYSSMKWHNMDYGHHHKGFLHRIATRPCRTCLRPGFYHPAWCRISPPSTVLYRHMICFLDYIYTPAKPTSGKMMYTLYIYILVHTAIIEDIQLPFLYPIFYVSFFRQGVFGRIT